MIHENDKEKEEKNKELFELAEFYKKKKILVHITTTSKKWYNGKIIYINSEFKDRLVLQEKKFGEMLIFFDKIKEGGIIPYEEKEEK